MDNSAPGKNPILQLNESFALAVQLSCVEAWAATATSLVSATQYKPRSSALVTLVERATSVADKTDAYNSLADSDDDPVKAVARAISESKRAHKTAGVVDDDDGVYMDEDKKPHLAMKTCAVCSARLLSKNMARHMQKHAAEGTSGGQHAESPSPATTAPSTPMAAPTSVGRKGSAVAGTPTPPVATQTSSTPLTTQGTPHARKISESMPQVREDNPLIVKFATSLAVRAKAPQQAKQDVTKVCKILHLMGTADKWSDTTMERDTLLLLTSATRLDSAVMTLRAGGWSLKTVVNYLDALGMFVTFALTSSEAQQRSDLTLAIVGFQRHVNDLRAGNKKKAAKIAGAEHTVENYVKNNKWFDWPELSAIMDKQIGVAHAIIDAVENSDPVDAKDLHFVTLTAALISDFHCTAKRGGEDKQLKAAAVQEALAKTPSIIENADFKTASKYGLKAYILTDEVRLLWQRYDTVIRPALHTRRAPGTPKSDYFFLSNSGGQLSTFEHDTTKYFQLITGNKDLKINHTQLRKMESTTAAECATESEADAMRVNRAHSDATSKAFYVKKSVVASAEKAAFARSKVFGVSLPTGLMSPVSDSIGSAARDYKVTKKMSTLTPAIGKGQAADDDLPSESEDDAASSYDESKALKKALQLSLEASRKRAADHLDDEDVRSSKRKSSSRKVAVETDDDAEADDDEGDVGLEDSDEFQSDQE